MSDALKQCGIALIRLLKPLEFTKEIWNAFYGIQKMYLLMEKQHNRMMVAGFASIN
jgi:amidophosphoribosyltransferase